MVFKRLCRKKIMIIKHRNKYTHVLIYILLYFYYILHSYWHYFRILSWNRNISYIIIGKFLEERTICFHVLSDFQNGRLQEFHIIKILFTFLFPWRSYSRPNTLHPILFTVMIQGHSINNLHCWHTKSWRWLLSPWIILHIFLSQKKKKWNSGDFILHYSTTD